jgi:hypothetical protein
MKQAINLSTNTTSSVVKDALRYNNDVEALPLLLADWNLNRYLTPVADNIMPEEEFGKDVELFPISSIVEPLRPGTKGINKAIVNQSIVASNDGHPLTDRFYVADNNDTYKYWISPLPTPSNSGFLPLVPQVPNAVETAVALSMTDKVNQWTVQAFPIATASSTVPTYDLIANAVADDTRYIQDNPTIANFDRDNWVGLARAVVYVSAQTDWTWNFTHDDGGAIYIDGVVKYASGLYGSGSLNVSLTPGYHVIDLMWAEQGGGEGFVFSNGILSSKVTNMWASSVMSVGSSVQPFVKYGKSIDLNKIVVKVENTWSRPMIWSVQIATNVAANNWTTISTDPTLPNDGNLVLFLSSNNSTWSTTKPATLGSRKVTGIRVVVNSLGGGVNKAGIRTRYKKRNQGPNDSFTLTNGTSSFFSLIAIEPHLEVNLTDRLITVNDTFDLSDSSQIYPIGSLTSNVAGVVLDNTDFYFNTENQASPYYGLLDANVVFNLQYIYNINGVKHAVQQFRMFTDGFGASQDAQVDITLNDSSKYLKEIKPRSTMYENRRVLEIIWRILDSIGFNDYVVDSDDLDASLDTVIPYFWTTGEQTVWEIFDELAKASQTAIYFDAYNKLQVRTRHSAFKKDAAVDWNLLGQKEGINLPDIVSLSQDDEFESNLVKVGYKKTAWRVNSYGSPALSKVWEPEGESLVVRASALTSPLADNATTFILNGEDADVWPYKSKVNINSEILEYDAKRYVYAVPKPDAPLEPLANHMETIDKWVTSQTEKDECDAQTPAEYRWMNKCSGEFRIKERGLWNSKVSTHKNDINNFTPRSFNLPFTQPGGHKHDPRSSTINMRCYNGIYNLMSSAPGGKTYNRFGTKIKFNSDDSVYQVAGMMTNNNGVGANGYYFHLRPTDKISPEARAAGEHEVEFQLVKSGNTYPEKRGSAAVPVLTDIWYELDVDISLGTDPNYSGFDALFHYIRVFLNGQLVWSGGVRWTEGIQLNTLNYGLSTRHHTNATFEYMYAVSQNMPLTLPDYSFYDIKYGGFRANLFEREYVYVLNTRYKKRVKMPSVKQENIWDGIIFEDFGSWVHEIREFDVKFDPAPVQSSSLFSTNNFYAAVLEYQSTPWGARFIVANAGREHAVLNGEDSLVYAGASSTVPQVFTVLGRDLEIKDAETIEVKNDQQIRKRGTIESEFASDWIQSKDMAQNIADWIIGHWGEPVDQLTVTTFGNPLIEVGDIVDISFNENNMTPATHKYFVVGTSTDFDAGIETKLTLRRLR